MRLLPAGPVVHEAFALALRHGQSLHGCLCLAMAERERGRFATADARFWRAMLGTPKAGLIHFIGTREDATGP